MRPRSLLLGGAALLLTLAAPGCSSSDPVATAPSSTASSSTTAGATGGTSPSAAGSTTPTGTGGSGSTTSTTAGAVTTTTTGTSTASAANSTTTRPDGAPAPPVDVAPEDQQFCAKVLDAQATLGQIDPSSDPAAALNAYRQVIAHLANGAPSGVKSDIDLINAAVQKATTYQDLVAMGTPELRAASDRIDAWTNAHCGTTLNG